MKPLLSFVGVLLVVKVCVSDVIQFEPNWESIDSRPLPAWYDKAKIGIFIHWGVFSVPSMGTEWFWALWNEGGQANKEITDYVQKNFPPNLSYQEFAKDFTAEFFDPDQWAELFVKAGARYVVLTSKHHEGFTLWPSKYSYSWNSKDLGPHRDIVGDLSTSVRSQNLTFGIYHSLLEWYHPLYLLAKDTNFEDRSFAENKAIPELYELVNTYKPSIIWSDGDWEAPDTYWNSTDFLAWLYNESPVKDYVVTNDRWGHDMPCNHGGYFTCNDRYNPGYLQERKWENAMSLDTVSFGYRRNAKLTDYLTDEELLTTLVQTIAYGGNLLINIGPAKDGTIPLIFQERLLNLGSWLAINGEAIYESEPYTPVQNDGLDPSVYYTTKNTCVYALVLSWPQNNILNLGSVNDLFESNGTKVGLLGNEGSGLKWDANGERIEIILPDFSTVKSKGAWVLKISI